MLVELLLGGDTLDRSVENLFFSVYVHIDVEARVGVPKSTIAVTGIGVTSRP